jgi:hypothetical protein
MVHIPKVQIKRTATPNLAPSGLSPGELAVEMGEPAKLWVGVPTAVDASGQKLLVDTSAGGTGNVVGPAASVANTFAVYADTTGKLLKPSNQSYATLNHTPAFHCHTHGSEAFVAVNAWQVLIDLTEDLDTDNCFSSSYFMPNSPGWYLIGGQVSLPSNGGQRGIAIWWGPGGSPSQYATVIQGGTAQTTQLNVHGFMYFNGSSDFVQLAAISDYPGGSINSGIFWGYKLFPFNVTP